MLNVIFQNLPSILCVLLGAGLIVVEVFLPGFGLPGISGIVLLGIGTIFVGVNYGLLTAVGVLLVIIAVLAVLISWVLRSAAKGGFKRSELFLTEKDELRSNEDMKVLVGRRGMTKTVLRPAGIGDFDGVRLNVVTEGGFIPADQQIEIIKTEGARIVVRSVDA